MGFVIYFLIKGDKQDKIDREKALKGRNNKKRLKK